jgi:hypothetical protein
MSRLPTGPVAAVSLVLGFAVAEVTGVRALGGVVLGLGVAMCWPQWRARVGIPGALGLALAYLVGFGTAHPLAGVLGAWPSVLVVAATVGLLVLLVADRASADSAPMPTDDGQ